MGSFCWIAKRAQLEILGLVPSNPRRNTSKEIFESLRSGDKVETCIRSVSSLYPLFWENWEEVDTKRRQSGYMSPLSYYLSLINS